MNRELQARPPGRHYLATAARSGAPAFGSHQSHARQGVVRGPIRSACLLLVLAHAALAAPPVITELQPRGAEIGRPFTLTLLGRNIGEGVHVSSTLAASFTLVLPSPKPGAMAAPGRSVAFLVEPKPDAAPGVYPIRIETPAGISNILLFTLGTFPEVTEEESKPNAPPNSNDSIETAEPVRSTPVVVNGTLRGPERDVYRVSGKADL